jgi:hypothetical protein
MLFSPLQQKAKAPQGWAPGRGDFLPQEWEERGHRIAGWSVESLHACKGMIRMDETEQRQFIRFLATEVKEYWRELAAHRILIQMLKDAGLPGVDKLLETARNSPELQKVFERHFAGFDKLIPTAAEEFDSEVRKFLEHWHPDGEPN